MAKFKVGDLVRATNKYGGLIIGETYTVASYARPTPSRLWVNLEGFRSNQSDDGSFMESSFELAPLKIEAGKYYRTRDGRKVGPLMARNNDSYAFAADIAGDIGIRIFQKDGVHGSRWIGNKPNLDLIAEWVDEPVKAASPVAVQQDAPELKVSLSFDAADVTNAIKSTLLKTNQGYGFEIARHGDYVWVDTGKKAPIVLKATDVQVAA